ncbi:MAG: PrsW family glutamic-type intramembrane protease [Ilumatobacter sp.]
MTAAPAPDGMPAPRSSPGWYPDPWASSNGRGSSGAPAMRWWDGLMWTTHVAEPSVGRPRLPAWASVPVLVCGGLVAIGLVVAVFVSPVAVALGFVPILIVAPVLQWFDRVEPEPLAARMHALLWGATVAVVVSVIVNTVVDLAAGTAVAAVVSAPIIEEITKAIGIVYAVRRHEVDGVMDGIVYAGWVALGFAVIEDVTYFLTAEQEGALLPTFILRAVLTPFAHPLFTAWTGLAIGRAVARSKPIFPSMLWGLALAIGSHALWNGSLVIGEELSSPLAVLLGLAVFVVLFITGMSLLIVSRRRAQRRFIELVPWLAQRYSVSPAEAMAFSDWATMRRIRRALPRAERRRFDGVHAGLARLALFHDQPRSADAATEAALADRLRGARYSHLD